MYLAEIRYNHEIEIELKIAPRERIRQTINTCIEKKGIYLEQVDGYLGINNV